MKALEYLARVIIGSILLVILGISTVLTFWIPEK